MKQYIDAIDDLDAMLMKHNFKNDDSDSFELKYDSEGRVIVPDKLLSFANIKNTAVFMGIGRSFLIWSDVDIKTNTIKLKKYLVKMVSKLILKTRKSSWWLIMENIPVLINQIIYQIKDIKKVFG